MWPEIIKKNRDEPGELKNNIDLSFKISWMCRFVTGESVDLDE